MKFEQYELVTSISKGANSRVAAGEIGTIAYATNSVVFIYWHNLKKITRQTSKAFSIQRATYFSSIEVSHEEVDNAYSVYKEKANAKANIALAQRRNVKRMSTQEKSQTTIVETPALDTPLGAVSALLNDVEFTPIEQSMILTGIMNILKRFNDHASIDGTLFVSGSAIDKANELSAQLDAINRKLTELGITPEQLAHMRGD
ncbi:hypothetical protein VPHF86_0213 [Vibrio phage F86]